MITIKKVEINDKEYYYRISKLAISMIVRVYMSQGVKMSFRDALGLLRSFKRVYIDEIDSSISPSMYADRLLIGENIDGSTVELLNNYHLIQLQSGVIEVKEVIEYNVDDIVMIGKGNEKNYGSVVDIKDNLSESGEHILNVRYGNKVIEVLSSDIKLVCRAENREDIGKNID